MVLENSGLEGQEITVEDLDVIMANVGFVRWAWDYKRATYDYLYVDRKLGENYYIRIPALAISGEIDEAGNDSVLRIDQPYIARHTYPHGFDYDFPFPPHVLGMAKSKLDAVRAKIADNVPIEQ